MVWELLTQAELEAAAAARGGAGGRPLTALGA